MQHITLVGLGNQGTAWAENLRDSGFQVVVSGRSALEGGGSAKKAGQLGLPYIEPEELHKQKGTIALLQPDEAVLPFFQRYFVDKERAGQTFVFAHGFAVTFNKIPFQKNDDVVLVAPKGIAKKLRENYLAGSGVMGVIGVEQDHSGVAWGSAEAIAKGLGCDRVEIVRSTFSEETYADLLSEQTILCGGVPRLLDTSIRFLIAKGVNPKIAIFECLNELQFMVDIMVEHGVAGMYEKISRTALVGGVQAGKKLLPDSSLQQNMEELWSAITSGQFAAALRAHGDKPIAGDLRTIAKPYTK